MGREIRILIADDHQPFRESLSAFLNGIHRITVAGEAGDGRKVEEMAMALDPDIVLSDIMMPRQNGIEAARNIRAHRPNIKIILFSMHEGDEFVNGKMDMADRFIPKQHLFDDLLDAINSVMEK